VPLLQQTRLHFKREGKALEYYPGHNLTETIFPVHPLFRWVASLKGAETCVNPLKNGAFHNPPRGWHACHQIVEGACM
jgi:hypothetical protein